MVTSTWDRAQAGSAVATPATTNWVVDPSKLKRMLAGRYVWDAWPLLNLDGSVARPFGRELWIAPSSETTITHPGQRHDVARLWLANATSEGTWVGEGALWDEGLHVGSRQWAGSSTMDPNTGMVTVLYTAAGVFGEETLTYGQRIIGTRGRLNPHGDFTSIISWEPHHDLFEVPAEHYKPPAAVSEPGRDQDALRHPAYFRDPRDGGQYVVFSATMAAATASADGAIGIARMLGNNLYDWYVQPPLLTADGVAHTLERPHLIERHGTYYLFATVHDRGFADGITAPHGLYGWWAPALDSPFTPLNGSGLVLTNPPEEPAQMSSWLVLRNGWVVGSAAYSDTQGRSLEDLAAGNPDWMADHYLGTLSTWTHLSVSRDGTRIDEQRYTPPLWDVR